MSLNDAAPVYSHVFRPSARAQRTVLIAPLRRGEGMGDTHEIVLLDDV